MFKVLISLMFAVMLVNCGVSRWDSEPQVGPKGDKGDAGQSIVGPVGPSGTPGIDGAGITAVPLCPGTTAYPGAFVEVAECINHILYAVYWDSHNAWLTAIPPGIYSSTSSSVPCTFTVLPNCVVQH